MGRAQVTLHSILRDGQAGVASTSRALLFFMCVISLPLFGCSFPLSLLDSLEEGYNGEYEAAEVSATLHYTTTRMYSAADLREIEENYIQVT